MRDGRLLVGWGTATDSTGETQGSYYIEANANYDLGDGWGILGHIGYQDVNDNEDASYTDWKLGVTKAFDNGFSVGVAYTGTDADSALYTNPLGNRIADDTFALTVTKAF